jgi:hypothetical protein
LIRETNIVDELAAAEMRSFLQGKRCWDAYASFACTFAMDIGRKIPCDAQELALRKRLAALRAKKSGIWRQGYRKFNSESHLLLWCSWRIDDAKGPLASSDSDFAECKQAVERLIGKVVQHVEIQSSWDLRLSMSSGLMVSVFPDHVGPEANFDGNWELWRPDRAYLVGTDLACEVIDRQNRPLELRPDGGRWQVATRAKVRK